MFNGIYDRGFQTKDKSENKYPVTVEKRNGDLVDFDFEKIINAIEKAKKSFVEENNYFGNDLDEKLKKTFDLIRVKLNYFPSEVISIEQIQDIVISSIYLAGIKELADKYCEYRLMKSDERQIYNKRVIKLIDTYINKKDWKINENANGSFSVQGLNLYTMSRMNEIYWKEVIYKEKLAKYHDQGDFHIHDLYLLAPYTYYGKEVVIVLIKDNEGFKESSEIRLMSFEQLYDFIKDREFDLDDHTQVYGKFPKDIYVLDKDGWTKVIRITKKKKNIDMVYIEAGNYSTIVTEDHPVITITGEIPANKVTLDDSVFLTNYKNTFSVTNNLFSISEINLFEEISKRDVDFKNKVYVDGIPILEVKNKYNSKFVHTMANISKNIINLTKEFGYGIGHLIALKDRFKDIDNKIPVSKKITNRVISSLLKNDIIVNIERVTSTKNWINVNNIFLKFFVSEVLGVDINSDEILFPTSILKYDKEFVIGILSGMLDSFHTEDITVFRTSDIVRIYAKNRTFVEQLSIILELLEIPIISKEYKKDNMFIISFINFEENESRVTEPKKFITEISKINPIEIDDEYIYDMTTISSTLSVNGIHSHNCVGWDLKALLERGFSGLSYKTECSPPKHFDSACGQIVNFLYTLTGECAGATSFSNVDTMLSPFITRDNLLKDRNRLNQYMQKFIYNLCVDTRVGFQCLSEDTEILTADGWKTYDSISMNDSIYTFNTNTRQIELLEIEGINIYRYNGLMIRFYGTNFDQLVTPNHRVLVENDVTNKWDFTDASVLIEKGRSFTTIKVDDVVDNNGQYDVTFSNYDVTRLGYEFDYDGIVWCPTTINETVIARRNGSMFITGNSPFTNFSFDLQCPDHMKNESVVVDGKYQNDTYGEHQESIDAFNDAFCDVMMKGDKNNKVFTFPIPTYCIDKEFDWDNPNLEKLWKMTGKYGIPYFSNYISTGFSKLDSRSMCCRLTLDLKEIRRKGGGLFGADSLTGSIGVVTINLPRIGHLANGDEDLFIERLNLLVENSIESLIKKTHFVEKMTDKGMYPYSKVFLEDIKKRTGRYWGNHFLTIGIIGMHEACINMFGEGIESEVGREFGLKVLKWLRERLFELQSKTGYFINLEATPAEGLSYKICQKDKKTYPEMRCFKENKLFYTNSTQLPINSKKDLWESLLYQEDFQSLYTGGTVFHGYVGNIIDDPNVVKNVIKRVLTNYKIPYFSLTPTFSICPNHGYISGEINKCPKCNKETLVYSRVVGYLRPVSTWNKGKRQEFSMRTTFENSIG